VQPIAPAREESLRNSRTAVTPLRVTIAAIGAALLIAAIAANQTWLDRHFLPSFFVPRPWYVLIERAVRTIVAIAGALLAIGSRRLARPIEQAPATAFLVVVAVALAGAAGEWTLRRIHLRPTEWLLPQEEPQRQIDPYLGWVLAPARVGRSVVGGRTIEYAIDSLGYRVRSLDEPVDTSRPTIVFAGESVMFGEGLTWDESVPAQTGATLGIGTANLAVHGYSTDQIYLRLARELPRFRQPLAVVSIFMTELFGRNLDDDRPHLAPQLIWQPAAPASRLAALAGLLVPYRRDSTVEAGVGMTARVLDAMMQLARARGATPLVIVPQFGQDDDAQRALRRRILTQDIPHMVIPLDPDWRLAWDRHPNARAARVIADAVAARLRRTDARIGNAVQ